MNKDTRTISYTVDPGYRNMSGPPPGELSMAEIRRIQERKKMREEAEMQRGHKNG